jgi:hypothetical protein
MLPKEEYPCRTWLLGLLDERIPTDSEDVKRWAAEMGYTKSDLKKARQELGVRTEHQDGTEFRREKWFWYLPED